jgi:beta-glucosidase
MRTYRFPAGFVWGAATSAYQIEGSPLADGASPSIQHRYAHTPGNTHQGQTGDIAADHYHRWPHDIQLMRDLGLHHYQYSIAWPRVLPEGTGRVNQAGLDFYDRLTDGLCAAGVTPTPILHVWDLPGVLQDRGGWANRDSAEWFAEFAAVVFDLIGDRASHWFTICEPLSIAHFGHIAGEIAPAMRDVYAGLRAAHHVLLAHGRAVQAFRASGATGQIGTSTIVMDVQPASDRPADHAAADRASAYLNELFLDPVMLGSYPAALVERFGDAWPPVLDGDLKVISSPVDFVGVTYYLGLNVADAASDAATDSAESIAATDAGQHDATTEPAQDAELVDRAIDPLGTMLSVRMMPRSGAVTGLGWPVNPEGVTNVLGWIRDRYGNPPIILTENGAAYPDVVAADGTVDDPDRIAYLREHFIAAHKAIEQGVDLRGWYVWSLLDTWEFSLGYKGRFGLIHVDYETQQRTVKSSGHWFREVMAGNGFEAP